MTENKTDELLTILKNKIFTLTGRQCICPQENWTHCFKKEAKFAFVYIQSGKKQLTVHIKIKRENLYDPKCITSDGYKSYSMPTKFTITDHNEADYAMQLIKQAYDAN
jgi:predicted transport protein